MRGNGLTAQSYAIAGLVSSVHAGDALLALRDVGVAAYVVLGSGDRVQVFADRDALPAARQALASLQGDAAADSDDAWTQIVTGWSRTAPDPQELIERPPRPPQDRAQQAPPRETPPPAAPPAPSAETGELNTPGTWEDEGHFIPPPVPPVGRGDRISRLAWTGLIGGPLLLLVATVFGWGLPTEILMLCLLGFVGGLVTLVVRMKDGDDDEPGNGAVI
jgi:hypothetical protein